jgi:hypothetical protein
VGGVVGAIKFRDGSVTTTLTGDLAAKMADRVRRASSGVVKVVEDALAPVARYAESEWYGPRGVTPRTGVSGDVSVVTVVDIQKATAVVSVGSAATEMVAKNKARAYFVHSPSPLAMGYETVTPEQYWRTPKDLRGPFRRPNGWRDDPGEAPMVFPVVIRHIGNTSSHGFLLTKLVVVPARKATKAILPKLAKAATGGK